MVAIHRYQTGAYIGFRDMLERMQNQMKWKID